MEIAVTQYLLIDEAKVCRYHGRDGRVPISIP